MICVHVFDVPLLSYLLAAYQRYPWAFWRMFWLFSFTIVVYVIILLSIQTSYYYDVFFPKLKSALEIIERLYFQHLIELIPSRGVPIDSFQVIIFIVMSIPHASYMRFITNKTITVSSRPKPPSQTSPSPACLREERFFSDQGKCTTGGKKKLLLLSAMPAKALYQAKKAPRIAKRPPALSNFSFGIPVSV